MMVMLDEAKWCKEPAERAAAAPPLEPRPRAIVWFADGAANGPWWLRLLKRGYRHCGVLIEDIRYDVESGHEIWTGINPRICGTEVHVWVVGSKDQILAQLADPLALVTDTVETRVVPPDPERPYPWFPCTCVEQVKRSLGLRGWFIWTPWQLYRRILDAD